MKSARVGLEKARQDLAYATITAPVSGTVVERGVDVGQTVAASFSAPQLFLIAGDLSRMRILASVDESDIGQIEEGQSARFTVQAYPDETFYRCRQPGPTRFHDRGERRQLHRRRRRRPTTTAGSCPG